MTTRVTRNAARRAHPASLAGLLAGGAALFVAGCSPAAVSREGRSIQDLYALFLVIATIVAAIVWGLLTWSVVRYRRRGPELPAQVHGNTRLELLWTAIPTVTVIGLFAATLVVLQPIEGSTQPAAQLEVRVEAFRWGWRFDYPAEGVSVSGAVDAGPEVVLPVGEAIRITLSAADVDHSFYVPQFLYKRDAIPGRETSFPLLIEQPGTFAGQCAEFCGLYHSRMPFTIRAVTPAEYRAWIAQQPRAAP